MAYRKEEGICPVCKSNSIITRKWVLNEYGKKYSYTIYHHEGSVHYVNQSTSISGRFKKGEMKNLLVEAINSENFKEGLFRAEDAKRALIKQFPNITIDSVRDNLYRLTKAGMLEIIRRGRQLFFINTIYKERLSFIDDSIKFVLKDIDGDSMFRSHISTSVIRNDKSWPLYYLPYKIFGDSETDFKDLQFKAYDISNKQALKTLVIEDKPNEKRLLIRLTNPLFPEESIKVRFEYNWEEPKQTFFFTAATQMNSFDFTLMGDSPMKVQATQSISTLNEIRDLSDSMVREKNRKWKYVYSVKTKSINAFSVIQLWWKTA
ncbi:MAG: hypothetical protein M1556_04865 [Candidatus Thermoplasmatota archaeon]|nr:hypothetical protein [Candidatus Thermoplasmatota archaeon]